MTERKSWAANAVSRATMRANRSRDTGPELAVRRLVHAMGLRYRVDCPPLAGLRRRADLVFRGARVAVFIDGCFWHGCPEHGQTPAAHADYWVPKLQRNRERDVETDEALRAAGWRVLRFWEHDDPAAAAEAIRREVLAGPGRVG